MAEEDFIRLSFPASYRYFTLIAPCLGVILESLNAPLDDQVSHAIELAIHETCTNIVQHAYRDKDGQIELLVSLKLEPSRVIVDLFDTGHSFKIADIPEPNLDEPQIHGYGLFLVRQLMDEVSYRSNTGQNHWRLIKFL